MDNAGMAVTEQTTDRECGMKARETVAIPEVFNLGSFWHGSIMPAN
jgi:hypothetical protein